MKVYVVNMMVDDEYGCREAQAVYASREDAEKWVAENQEYEHPWFCKDEEGVPLYEIEEFELQ